MNDDLNKLNREQLLPQEAFAIALRGREALPDDYVVCGRAWHNNDMQKIEDFLRWYNLDVMSFLRVIN